MCILHLRVLFPIVTPSRQCHVQAGSLCDAPALQIGTASRPPTDATNAMKAEAASPMTAKPAKTESDISASTPGMRQQACYPCCAKCLTPLRACHPFVASPSAKTSWRPALLYPFTSLYCDVPLPPIRLQAHPCAGTQRRMRSQWRPTHATLQRQRRR